MLLSGMLPNLFSSSDTTIRSDAIRSDQDYSSIIDSLRSKLSISSSPQQLKPLSMTLPPTRHIPSNGLSTTQGITTALKTHQNAPKTHQNAPKTHPNALKTHQNAFKTHQNAFKTHQNASVARRPSSHHQVATIVHQASMPAPPPTHTMVPPPMIASKQSMTVAVPIRVTPVSNSSNSIGYDTRKDISTVPDRISPTQLLLFPTPPTPPPIQHVSSACSTTMVSSRTASSVSLISPHPLPPAANTITTTSTSNSASSTTTTTTTPPPTTTTATSTTTSSSNAMTSGDSGTISVEFTETWLGLMFMKVRT